MPRPRQARLQDGRIDDAPRHLAPTAERRRLTRYRWVPGRISGSVPAPLTGEEAASELAYWQSLRSCTGLAP